MNFPCSVSIQALDSLILASPVSAKVMNLLCVEFGFDLSVCTETEIFIL